MPPVPSAHTYTQTRTHIYLFDDPRRQSQVHEREPRDAPRVLTEYPDTRQPKGVQQCALSGGAKRNGTGPQADVSNGARSNGASRCE
jgi:hypothetical protein